MTRERLIRARLAAATPGPWHYVHCDDDCCMNAVYVSTRPESEEPDGPPSDHVICGTLVQTPATIGKRRGNWYADGDFIANAPADIQYLLDENARLREQLQDKATDAAPLH